MSSLALGIVSLRPYSEAPRFELPPRWPEFLYAPSGLNRSDEHICDDMVFHLSSSNLEAGGSFLGAYLLSLIRVDRPGRCL
jgi:hypothetical protein